MGEKIYAAGGFDGVGLLSTVEEMSGDQWVQVAPMPLGVRGGCAGVSVAGRIYVIGGASGEARLPRMESMDPREGRWVKEGASGGVLKMMMMMMMHCGKIVRADLGESLATGGRWVRGSWMENVGTRGGQIRSIGCAPLVGGAPGVCY